MLTDGAGAWVYRAEYDPHGQILAEFGGATYLDSRKFTGYERDWATNLDYAKARTYHHNRGRFMQADPLGLGAAEMTDPLSLNLYSYVGNDPANFVDPSGLNKSCRLLTFDWSGWEGDTYVVNRPVAVWWCTETANYGGGGGGDVGDGRGGGGGGNGSSGSRDEKLDLEKFAPCFIDALVNAGIGLVPGGGVAQAALNYFGLSLNPAQWLMGQSSFVSGQADLIDSAKAMSSVAKDVAEISYSAAGGDVALNRARDLVARKSFETASQAQQMKRLASLDKLTKLGKTAKVLPVIAQAMVVIGLIKDTKLCYGKRLK